MSKIKTVALATLALAATSCSNNNQQDNNDNEKKEVVIPQIPTEDTKLYQHFRDSLLTECGYNQEEYYALKNRKDSINGMLNAIAENYRASYRLQREVEEKINKIGAIYAEKIKNILKTYKLSPDEDKINYLCGYERYSGWSGCKYDAEQRDKKEAQEYYNNPFHYEKFSPKLSFEDLLSEDTSDNNYGEQRKEEILNEINKQCQGLRREQEEKRLQTAKKYAKYFPDLEIDSKYTAYFHDSFFMETEGDICTGYEYHADSKYAYVAEEVSVYDSKLSVDFFGDENATYTLKSIGPDKWQVVKETRDGKIHKTPIFEDKREPEIYGVTSDEAPSDHFDYTPGANLGVRVTSFKILYVKAAKEDPNIKLSPDDQELKAALTNERDSIEARIKTLNSIRDEAEQKADSLYGKWQESQRQREDSIKSHKPQARFHNQQQREIIIAQYRHGRH